MRPDVPYDQNHPTYADLSPEDQKKLNALNKKIDLGRPLFAEEKPELRRIKDFMDDPSDVDETHPGFEKLSKPDQEDLRGILAKQRTG